MTVGEIFEKITRVKHRMRVYSLLSDTLRTYLDRDIGKPDALEAADGCLVRYVPKEVIHEILYEEIHSVLDVCKQELARFEALEIGRSYTKKAKESHVAPLLSGAKTRSPRQHQPPPAHPDPAVRAADGRGGPRKK